MSNNTLPTAGGYPAFTSGDHIPVIFSKKMLTLYKQVLVADSITNTAFQGEIASYGTSVKIIRQPEVAVRTFGRGSKFEDEYQQAEDITLQIDQGLYTSISFDELDLQHSHIDWINPAAERSMYALREKYDRDILLQMVNGAQVGNKTNPSDSFTYLGTAADPLIIGHGAGEITPLDLMQRLRRSLVRGLVPDSQMFTVFESGFYAKLGAEASKFIEADTMGSGRSVVLADSYRGRSKIHGFELFETETLPSYNGGVLQPTSLTSDTFVVLAGSKEATATAKTLLKAEVLKPTDVLAKVLRSYLVYGRKVVRPDALAVAHVKFNS